MALSLPAHHQGHGAVVARGVLCMRRSMQEAAGGHLILRAGRSTLLSHRLWAAVRGPLCRLHSAHNGECHCGAQRQVASGLLQVQGGCKAANRIWTAPRFKPGIADPPYIYFTISNDGFLFCLQKCLTPITASTFAVEDNKPMCTACSE